MGVRRVKVLGLYPKELNLYGDRGNALCILKRLEGRGFKAEYISAGIGDRIPDFDIMLIGGGQDKEMKIISRDIKRKSETLSFFVRSGKVIFGVCGGFQLLGEYYKAQSGELLRLSGALPFYTEAGEKRRIGNLVIDTPFGKVAGFENHSGLTYLGDLKPLGRVLCGFGNCGDGGEGVIFNNTFGTYAHGPVLPKNPTLADALIMRALCCDELAQLDDEIENKCHSFLIKKFKK